MRKPLLTVLSAAAVATLLVACATTTQPGAIGIKRQQLMLVSASLVEKIAVDQYLQQNAQARQKGKLIESGPQLERLRRISARLIAHTGVFRDTSRWNWQVVLIDDPQINASCAPGGKITFYTGILETLQLTDAEVAAIMGHEIAHALREHGRESVSQALLAQGVVLGGALMTDKPQETAALGTAVATLLFTLPNSREHEREADRMGLELMARAGYDPGAAITLWQKMSAQDKGKLPQFLSTHPSDANRIRDLTGLQPRVAPLYQAAPRP
ncbi:MAG: hypothetical protein RL026_1667 [Pseudomonadota bacterium]|jgi:predicted Zn-dependent protease